MPRLEDWSITGNKLRGKIFESKKFKDGTYVITSDVIGKDINGRVVTRSGSFYKLGAVEENKYEMAASFYEGLQLVELEIVTGECTTPRLADIAIAKERLFKVKGSDRIGVLAYERDNYCALEFDDHSSSLISKSGLEEIVDFKQGYLIKDGVHRGDNRAEAYKGKVASLIKDLVDRLYLRFDDGVKMMLWKENVVSCYYREEQIVIGPPSRMVKFLEDTDYVFRTDRDESYWSSSQKYLWFNAIMLDSCGRKPDPTWKWEPEWLEIKFTFLKLV